MSLRFNNRRPVLPLLLALFLGVLAGCSRTVPRPTEDGAAQGNEDPLEQPRELVRKAADTPDYYTALDQVNKHLLNTPDALTRFDPADRAAFRKLLTDRLALDEDEVQEVEAPRFTPLDAHYLEFCCHLRDAARVLRLHEPQRAKGADRTALALLQARVAFNWAMRQVMLEEKGGELLPAPFALRQGRGNGRDRALVFLALLHQLGLDGCMIALPGPAPETPNYRLAGVLIPEAGVYLFDPRLGIPLPGPGGKGIATLADLRSRKDLFAPLNLSPVYQYDITPEQAAQAEVHLVFPLSALAPRMRYLEEEVFPAQDRVSLALQPVKVLARFEAAKVGPVKVWNRRSVPGKPRPVTPTRALRMYLPSSEGGIDRDRDRARDGDRYDRHKRALTPWAPVLANLYEMKIYKELPGEAGEHQLRTVVYRLFRKYIQAPQDDLVRERLEGASKALVKILTVLNDPILTQLDDAKFEAKVDVWLKRAKQAFLDRKKPGGQRAFDELWAEDQYLVELVTTGGEEVDLKKLPRGALSEIVLRAAREPLRREATYLQALRWQEKAEQLQARRELLDATAGAKEAARKKVAADVKHAWTNAEDNWGIHNYEHPFTVSTLKGRVRTMVALSRDNEADLARALQQQTLHDLRRSLTARLWHAHALVQEGKTPAAIAALRELVRQAEAVEAAPEMQGLRKARSGDLTPTGTVFWLRYRAEFEIRRLTGKAG